MVEQALLELPLTEWSGPIDPALTQQAVAALEAGKLVVMPHLAFRFTGNEAALLSANVLPNRRKNISLDPSTGRVGAAGDHAELAGRVMSRFATATTTLLTSLLVPYTGYLRMGRTSLRPAEIEGRTYSRRHDDRLLHVDAFPTRPTRGDRILRIFTNLPCSGCSRQWRVGGSFETVAARFKATFPKPAPFRARIYSALGLTKDLQSGYDQIMLALHDRMKLDADYQRDEHGTNCSFAPGTTWLCFSDQVPHAALAGRWAMEQTFYLPVQAMVTPETSPLRVLERLTGGKLAA